MHIVHVISYFQTQIGYQEYYLAKVQQSEGHTVSIITSDRYWPFPNYEISYKVILGERIVGTGEFTEDSLRVIRLPVIFEFPPLLMLKNLKSTLCDLSPDIIISHGLEFPVSWQVGRIKAKYLERTILIIDSHSGSYNKSHNFRRKVYGKLWSILSKNILLKFSSKVIAVTKDGKETLGKYFDIPPEYIEVIPLGVDVDLFKRRNKERKKIRKTYNIKALDIVGIYSGKIAAFKGIYELLEALKQLFEEFNSFKFIFIGFPTETELVDRIKSVSPQQCFYSEPVEARFLSHYYSAADFGIWPKSITASHYEAMSCSLPIIVSHLEASKERIQWNNGFSLENESPQEIYDIIRKLITNPKILSELGYNSRNAIINHFSWRSLNRAFLKVPGCKN